MSFDAGVGGCELPIRLGVQGAAALSPGGDFGDRAFLSEMRRSRHWVERTASSDLAMLEPASVLGRVMPFEPFDEATRLGSGEGLVERGGGVRAQIVLNQNDLVGAGKMHCRTNLERVGVIDGGASRSATFTRRQPSSGANIIKRLATPLRSYS